MAIVYQQDFKIVLPGTVPGKRATLLLSPTGDIQLSEGNEKLTAQLTRAIVNDQALGNTLINTKAVRYRQINTMLTILLRSFRNVQLDETNKYDPDTSGFSVWRRGAGTTGDFVRVSDKAVKWQFEDTNLNNGTTYEYGITSVRKDIYETSFLDTLEVTPTRFSSRQKLLIGETSAVQEGDTTAKFYVDYNRYFLGSELLNSIEEIRVYQRDDDPRYYTVTIKIKDLNNNLISVSNGKIVFK